MRIGGEEDLRRASHDSYRSRSSFTLDSPRMVRKSVNRIRSIGRSGALSPGRKGSQGSISSEFQKKGSGSESSIENIAPDERDVIKAISGIGDELQVAYLLVSPLQGWINALATMWSSSMGKAKDAIPEHDMKFTVDPTLAIFGDDDVFVSVKKLRAWVEKLTGTAKGTECQFRYKEVAGAGHFWHDHEAVKALREEIKTFVATL